MSTGSAAVRSASVQPSVPPISRRDAIFELGCLLFLIELIMWVVPFLPNLKLAYGGLAMLILILLVVVQLRDGATAYELGFRFDNFLPVLGRISAQLAPFIAIIVLIGFATHSLNFGKRFFGMLLSVPLWALLQQYMLLAFVNRRLHIILGEGHYVVIATALLFALLHLPNPMLTVACALAGYIWTRAYERSPNLLANAMTHAIASAFIANSLPHWLLQNMVVGTNHFYR